MSTGDLEGNYIRDGMIKKLSTVLERGDFSEKERNYGMYGLQ